MRHNLTITILALLLLFQNEICQGRRIVDIAKDDSNFPDVGHEDLEDELNSGDLSEDTDDDPVDAPEEVSRIKRSVYAEDVSMLDHGGSHNSQTHENLKSEDPLSESESRASATGISVANGRAVGYGKASVSGGDRGYVNGRGQAYNPGVETAEEFGVKSGKDIAIARVGGGGRSGEGASVSGGGYPSVTYPVDSASEYGAQGGAVRPITGSADERNAYAGNPYYGNEKTPTGPVPGTVDERFTSDRGYVNERAPTRPVTRPVDERVTYNTRYGNKGTSTGTGFADNRGTYDRGYRNEQGPSKPTTGYHGTDRRVVDERYPAPDVTGVKLTPTTYDDGRVVYAYDTDGRPTRVVFTDRNGGMGVVNHFFEKKNLDNGLSGARKVTGTSFRSGFSLAYGGGNSGNSGAVAYGGGNSGAAAFGNGVRIPGNGGYGLGNEPSAAYGSSIGGKGPVAIASGSGFVSGTGISLGDAYVGSRNGKNPGARNTGFSLKQRIVMGNGKGNSRSEIYV